MLPFSPSGSDIPDSPDSLCLGIINYEWITQKDSGLLQALSNFYRNSPAGGGQRPRQYKNNIAVLIADHDGGGDMALHARRCLAARYIMDNPPESLQKHQMDSLETELASAVKDLYIAIQRLYVNLYYPSTDSPISNDTLMHYVRISPEVASEKPGDGQNAVLQTLVSRRKLITLNDAELDPESYWKMRRNLLRGKVDLVSLKEEFAREPSNYMLLNNGVADTLLRKALDREAIVIETGAGQTITEGNELVRTDDSKAWVYLKGNACPHCYRYRDDCRCGKEEPQLCPRCGKEQHPGPCEVKPIQPTLLEVAAFSSGMQLQPLNVLAAELGRHMEQHNLTFADIAVVTLGGDKAEFISYVSSYLGQRCTSKVSYSLHRENDLDLTVKDMDMAEWSRVLNRVAPVLERIKGSSVTEANVNIPGDGNQPEQLGRILTDLPSTNKASMVVTFRPRSEELPSGE